MYRDISLVENFNFRPSRGQSRLFSPTLKLPLRNRKTHRGQPCSYTCDGSPVPRQDIVCPSLASWLLLCLLMPTIFPQPSCRAPAQPRRPSIRPGLHTEPQPQPQPQTRPPSKASSRYIDNGGLSLPRPALSLRLTFLLSFFRDLSPSQAVYRPTPTPSCVLSLSPQATSAQVTTVHTAGCL